MAATGTLRGVIPGAISLGAVVVLIGGALFGLIVEGGRDWASAVNAVDGYMWRLARFTLLQATLSTVLSVVPGLILARALSHHPKFFGRGLILKLFAVPLALPAIVAAMEVLDLFGRAGYLAGVFNALSGSSWPGVYGLSGVLIAHVFFNLPLATRFFLEALDTVPADQWRLASQLGLRPLASFRFIEVPVLRQALPGVAGLIFMLCVTSFTIVLTLGGGPAASTLELGIYQALRFDFDPARAVAFTAAQIALTVIATLVLTRLGGALAGDPNLMVAPRRNVEVGPGERIVNVAVITVGAAFVLGPIAAVAISGLRADLTRLLLEPAFLAATFTSLVLATISATLASAMAWSLASSVDALGGLSRHSLGRFADSASLVLVVPPIVIGAGWFILLRRHVDVFSIAPVMIASVNAVMAMPFALRVIRPAHEAASVRHRRLCAQLGLSGWNRIRLVDWPVLRRPMATAFAFAMALSLGDLGVVALFGSDALKTLPYLLYERMGSYRTADAAGLAFLLGMVCFLLVLISDWLRKENRR